MTNSQHYRAELFQERLALRIAARLSDSSDAVGHDIAERLRFARIKALARRKVSTLAVADGLAYAGGSGMLGGAGQPSWWQRMGAVIPLLALVVGLIAIQSVQNERFTQELANVDAALLMDDLPPQAYADPGFSQFLKINRASSQ